MSSLVLALIPIAVMGAICGYVFGLCTAFAKDGLADPLKHPLLHRLTRRSSRLINIPLSLCGWALFIYGIPKLAFLIVGIEDTNAFGIAVGLELIFAYVGAVVGERRWKHDA